MHKWFSLNRTFNQQPLRKTTETALKPQFFRFLQRIHLLWILLILESVTLNNPLAHRVRGCVWGICSLWAPWKTLFSFPNEQALERLGKSFSRASFHTTIDGADKRTEASQRWKNARRLPDICKNAKQMSGSLHAFFYLWLVSVLSSASSILKWNEVLENFFP